MVNEGDSTRYKSQQLLPSNTTSLAKEDNISSITTINNSNIYSHQKNILRFRDKVPQFL